MLKLEIEQRIAIIRRKRQSLIELNNFWKAEIVLLKRDGRQIISRTDKNNKIFLIVLDQRFDKSKSRNITLPFIQCCQCKRMVVSYLKVGLSSLNISTNYGFVLTFDFVLIFSLLHSSQFKPKMIIKLVS